MKRSDKKALEQYLKKLQLVQSGATVNPDETTADKAARIARAKKDFRFMVSYYFSHYATCDSADFHVDFAKRVKRDKVFKGFAEWGRGLAKSVNIDILILFWLWMNDEAHFVVLIGQSED